MSDAHHDFPAIPGQPDEPHDASDCSPLIAAADAWHCMCALACSAIISAQCLRNRALDAACSREAEGDMLAQLIGPLATAVAEQRTAAGQALCAQFFEAITAGDHATALDTCGQLAELGEMAAKPRGWDEPTDHI